jgi:hypothetical protein
MATNKQNIELLKQYLEDGYIVNEIAFAVESEQYTTKVVMKRNNEKYEITAVNDSDFLEYMGHFQRVRDQYDNSFLVYVEDAAAYRQAVQQGTASSLGEFSVHLGDRVLENDIFMFTLIEPGPGKRIGRAHFTVPIEKNKSFDDVDLKDEVKIFRKTDSKLVFGGYVNELTYSGKQAVFICEGGQRTFKIQRISTEFLNFVPVKAIYFTTRVMGAKAVFSPDLIGGLDLREKEFIVIAPIRNLILKRQITIGDVNFQVSLDSEDDHIVRKSETGQTDPDWNGNFPRARVVVKATNHFDAIMNGYEKISRVMDWMAFRSDISFTKFDSSEDLLSFNNFKYFSRATLTSKVFCRARYTREVCLYDMQSSMGTTLSLEYDVEKFLAPAWNLFKEVISKQDSELTETQRLAVRALYWLRLALHSNDSVTRLLNLWLSLEFASSGIKAGAKFSAEEIDAITKQIQAIRSSDKDLSGEQKKILSDKLSKLNDAPLMERMNKFIVDNGIPFTEREFGLLKSSRTKRNEIIHGRGNVQVEQQELDKLQSLIERIVLARLRHENAKASQVR